jgi:hypothetical protein
MRNLCQRLKVWQDPEVDLRGISVDVDVPLRSKNDQVLKAWPALTTVVQVSGSTPFYHNTEIMDYVELKVLTECPGGDITFFPFEHINQCGPQPFGQG